MKVYELLTLEALQVLAHSMDFFAYMDFFSKFPCMQKNNDYPIDGLRSTSGCLLPKGRPERPTSY
jgi:hypothetical protein